MPNRHKIQIKLKTSNNGRKTVFYGFDAVSYLAFKIDTPNAIQVRETIADTLDTMFNVITGKESVNSNKDWLKNQCEAKQLQAIKCKGASKLLYEGGLKHDADKIWSKHKKLEAEALKFKEMFLDYERLDREVASVRDNRTEQLKLI